MLSKIRDKNIWTIYGAILILGTAYGIPLALLANHLDLRGFTKLDIGSLASWFALGIVAFSLPMDAIIRRFSAKRTLIVALAGYAVTVSLFPALHSFTGIAIDRFADGAFSVGIWVSCETILLSRAPREMKAYITTIYAMSIGLGYAIGGLIAAGIVHIASIPPAFLASGAISVVATVLVARRLDPDDGTMEHALDASERGALAGSTEPRVSAGALLGKIKTSCFGTFAYGYFQASVVLFLPLYLIEAKGISREGTFWIPVYFTLGMLLFSNAAGKFGDRRGHLYAMRVLAVIGTSMILGFVFLSSYWLMALAVFVAGASLAAISPVSLALQGVVTPPREYSRSNSIYNAFYAAGMLLGPKISSILFDTYGGAAMLYHLTAIWVAFILFTIVYAHDDPAASGTRPVTAVAEEA